MSITRIVITGGPCAGKTTVLSCLTNIFSERGYKVLVVPESATELIPNGVVPGMLGMSMEEFQKVIIQKQIDKEELYNALATKLVPYYEKVLILYDRGIMDGQAYVSQEAFDHVLQHHGLDRSWAMRFYNGVIHLVTAALSDDESLYTTANNAARFETAEQARELDGRTLAAWVGHPHLRAIQPQANFEDKLTATVKEVCAILGDPEPVELEHKYLIARPTEEFFRKYGAVESTIVQTYLRSNKEGVERRVRQRTTGDGGATFFYTEKECRKGSNGRIERERIITAKEYCALLKEADCHCPVLVKTRYCFMFHGRYLELDVYPTETKRALLEVEVADEKEAVELPPEIEVIKEVTDNHDFRNWNIAMRGNRFPVSIFYY